MFNKFFANIASIAWIHGIPATVAIDVTDELYYGDNDGMIVTPTKSRKGAKFAFRFLTASIVSRFGKFVRYTRLIRLGENVSKLVRSVVRAVRKVVDIKWLVLDKWFYNVAVVKGPRKEGVPYIIAVPVRENQKRLLATLKRLSLGTIWAEREFQFGLLLIGTLRV